jgi:hypothetical protein
MDEIANARFRRELQAAFAGLVLVDDTPITGVHSWGLSEDAGTFSVYVDMPDGVTRIFSFAAGEPVAVTDHKV